VIPVDQVAREERERRRIRFENLQSLSQST
jgi:hypothetical protein